MDHMKIIINKNCVNQNDVGTFHHMHSRVVTDNGTPVEHDGNIEAMAAREIHVRQRLWLAAPRRPRRCREVAVEVLAVGIGSSVCFVTCVECSARDVE